MKTFASLLVLICITPAIAQDRNPTSDIVDTAVAAGNFKTLATVLTSAELVDTLKSDGPFTVFAPTDEAFAKLPKELIIDLLKPENKVKLAAILTYHVVPGRFNAKDVYSLDKAGTVNGQQVTFNFDVDLAQVNEANIVKTDIECSNGIIHVIDSVILPKSLNIPETAQTVGAFKTLLAAVNAAELGGVLSGAGPFTVFAPTDDAFAKLPEGTIADLLKPENKQKLINVLKYHVVSGRIYSPQAVKSGSAQTLLGSEIKVSFSSAGVKVNDAKIVTKDIETSNGVIHVIDTVLIPKGISSDQAVSMIQDAINRGVPVFNSGHHERCAKIYMETLTTMADQGFTVSNSHVDSTLMTTMSQASNTSCMTTRAWTLRRGMDSIHHQMSQMSSKVQR